MRYCSALIVASLLCAVSVFAAETNLVNNPGFEAIDAATNMPQEWVPTYWSNPKGKMEAAPEAHSGAHSLKITGVPREQVTDAGKSNNHLMAQELGDRLVGPARVTMRVWVKTDHEGSAYCSMATADKDGKSLQYLHSRHVRDQQDWTELVWDFSTEPETRKVTLYLRNDGTGSVWFDDVSIVSAADVLENDFARVLVDPLVGGRIRSFILKPGGREATVWQGVRPGGMAAEIVPAEEYPGVLRDTPSSLEVIEPKRALRVRHQEMGGDNAGLQIEREMRLVEGSASVEVIVRVRNTAAEPRTLSLRAQQCLPPQPGVFSWPGRSQVRVVQTPPALLKASIPIDDLREGWLAYSDPKAACGMVMVFDQKQTQKALIYLSQDLYTLEWYYRPVELPPGGSWETTYLIAPVVGGAPIVGVAHDLAVSLSPLTFPAPESHTLSLFPLRGAQDAVVQLEGKVSGKTVTASSTVKLTPTEATSVKLPWPGPKLQQLRLVAGKPAQTVTLSAGLINDKPLHDLPPPPEQTPFPALAGFFPFGEYYRGYVGPEMGTPQAATARQLRTYRRAYLNTYTVGENQCLGPLKAGQPMWLCDLVRQYRVRLIMKGDLLRRFETKPGGSQIELPAPPGTREALLDRIKATGFDPDVRRSFAAQYGDLILGYDLSDEPGSEYVPAYVQMQALFREMDPAHPVMVILNLDRTEYLPYMPVYYGDEYPIHNTGRTPWEVAQIVRFCARKTPAPVWVMLQAFGGHPDYPWQLPTAPETRLTIWLVVANGGKGITWHGSQSPPCWRYNQWYWDTLCDSWGMEAPGWAALRDAGRQVTAIGPALQQTDYVTDHPFSAETEQLDLGKGMYQGPAVTLGVLKQRDGGGYFVVAVNQDVAQERQATLRGDATKAGAGAQLCDLLKLTPPGAIPPAGVQFALAPGDGRVFYCGTPASCLAVLATVHRAHYENERVIYDMDAGVATANGVDIAAAAELARQAAAAYEKHEYEAAHSKLTAAQVKLAETVAVARPLGEVLAQLQESLSRLSEVARVYKEDFDIVVPPANRKGVGQGRYVNTQDSKLQQYVDDTAEAFCRRLLLEDRVYAGEAQAVAPEAAQLLAQAKRLQAEAIPYVRGKTGGTP